MYILKVDTAKCEIGSILASDVTGKNGVVLAAQGIRINSFIRDKLMEMGIKTVKVYDIPDKKHMGNEDKRLHRLRASHMEAVVSVKTVLEDLAVGKHVECSKINHIAEIIFRNMNSADSVMEYLRNIKACDDYTYHHSINVAFYSMLIGKWMHMRKENILELIISGCLHDIGKLGISQDVLNKKGSLSAEEYKIIKQHSTIGFEMLEHSNSISEGVKEAVLLHHERMDGSGYPAQAMGDSICNYAKIIAVADVYDAMTSDRIYKRKATPFSAFRMFLTEGTRLFEPSVVKAFVFNVASYMIGTRVLLNNGRIGEVVYVPPHEIDKPIVYLDSRFIDLSKDKLLEIESLV